MGNTIKIAIIGASTGQLALCIKAKELGLETYCFAYEEGAICKSHVDHFFPISITNTEDIIEKCKEIGINGVVTNASELTANITSYIAERLNLNGVPHKVFINIQNKAWVRQVTNDIEGLTPVTWDMGDLKTVLDRCTPPCILKPINGSAKKGVNYISKANEILDIDNDLKDSVFMTEEFINGQEYSVESISFHGQHYVIQITEKVSTGAPHFVELEHHQPAALSKRIEDKIKTVIPRILDTVGFTNGATHVEIKIKDENIYLIEINPRGGGGCISNILVSLSTNCDYIKQIILVALDKFKPEPITNKAYAGIYFLSAYTRRLLPYFEGAEKEWMVERYRANNTLTESTSNYDRDGYLIYCSKHKISI